MSVKVDLNKKRWTIKQMANLSPSKIYVYWDFIFLLKDNLLDLLGFHSASKCILYVIPSKLLISSYFSAKTFFFAKLSNGYPVIFSDIEICTAKT
jgi:hypothetical protein